MCLVFICAALTFAGRICLTFYSPVTHNRRYDSLSPYDVTMARKEIGAIGIILIIGRWRLSRPTSVVQTKFLFSRYLRSLTSGFDDPSSTLRILLSILSLTTSMPLRKADMLKSTWWAMSTTHSQWIGSRALQHNPAVCTSLPNVSSASNLLT